MFTTSRARRSAWLAGLAIIATTTLTLPPAAQAWDVGPPVVKDGSCVNLREELVFDPGDGFEPGVPHAPHRQADGRSQGLLRAGSTTAAPTLRGAAAPKAADLTPIIALDPSLRFETKRLGDAEIAPHWGRTVLKKLPGAHGAQLRRPRRSHLERGDLGHAAC